MISCPQKGILPAGHIVVCIVLSLFGNAVKFNFIMQVMMSMFHDLGFVCRHHIIPDRLARYVPHCAIAML